MKTLSLSILSSVILSSSLFGVTLKQTNTDNSLIIYNSNIGLVHEKRELKLDAGDKQIIYTDVAQTINTDSVNVELPSEVSLFSQQYRFDKLTQQKLLDAHIGKIVSVRVEDNEKNFRSVQATLLSSDNLKSIVKTDDELIITVENKNIIFSAIPNELITKPSLVWNIETQDDVDSQISIDYLIHKINWKSNYILNLKEDKADLTGWVTIDNRSGKSFKETSLHVLAGDINRAKKPQVNYRIAKSMMTMDSPEMKHKAVEGYHFYSVPFKVNLANNEKTQIKFITQKNIEIQRKYNSTMNNPNHLKGEISHDVTQHLTLDGFKDPLPQGVVRSYSKLKDTNILLGETRIQHTPTNTPLSLKLGKNFDVKVKETFLNFDNGAWNLDVDIKYTIKNSSKDTKTIEILIPFNRNKGSKVTSEEKYEYTKGNLVTFNIEVKAQSSKEFKVHFKTKK